MSYGIIPYRISLDRLQSRIGMNDIAKKNKLKESCIRHSKNIDSLANSAETPKFMDIVDELLNGKINHINFGYIYWYAIKYFIEDLGNSLPNTQWYPSSAEIFFEHPSFDLYGIDFVMTIPKPEDFPTVFVLPNEKMDELLINSLKEKIVNVGQFSELNNWIVLAKKYKEDLVLYYH